MTHTPEQLEALDRKARQIAEQARARSSRQTAALRRVILNHLEQDNA